MAKLAVIATLLLVPCFALGQEKNVQKTLRAVLAHAEEASLYRNSVDWDTLRTNAIKRGQAAKSVAELKPTFEYLLRSLGDEHGRVIHNQQVLASYSSSEPKPHLESLDPEIYRKIQWVVEYPFHAELLDGDIGYVRIVGLPMGDNEKMARDIEREVCKLIAAGAKSWIVDLRYNGGGNMHPMAEGITAIIGTGMAGGSQGLTDEESSTWRVENGHFYYDEQSIELTDSCAIAEAPKVAVLTSIYTASSGEALAAIFKGRPNTKSFGQKTLGLTTVTDWHVIDETTAMTISVSTYKDRNGNVFNDYVDVDVELPFAEKPLSDRDECLKQALKWLEE